MTVPTLSEEEHAQLLNLKRRLGITEEAFLYGVRGFFPSLGKSDANDRGIYDDAIFLVDSFCFRGWNANTDPSKHQAGIAVLRPGLWYFKKGKHGWSKNNPYDALVQATDFTIERDKGKIETGRFYINIHKGGNYETGSAGCQTIVKDQWPSFIQAVYRLMEKHEQKLMPYILVEKKEAVA